MKNEPMIEDKTEKELKIATSKLKLNKSPGSDGFTAEWYEELKEELIPVMLPALNWVLKKHKLHQLERSNNLCKSKGT